MNENFAKMKFFLKMRSKISPKINFVRSFSRISFKENFDGNHICDLDNKKCFISKAKYVTAIRKSVATMTTTTAKKKHSNNKK